MSVRVKVVVLLAIILAIASVVYAYATERMSGIAAVDAAVEDAELALECCDKLETAFNVRTATDSRLIGEINGRLKSLEKINVQILNYIMNE
jgi:hypothetical protein